MAKLSLEQRETRILRWAPILLLVSLVWFAWSMFREPLSSLHLFVWIVIGIIYGPTLLFQLLPKWNVRANVVSLFIVGAIAALAGRERTWLRLSEGVSVVLICTCAFASGWVIVSRRVSRSDDDVEQIVGPERRERVSQQP